MSTTTSFDGYLASTKERAHGPEAELSFRIRFDGAVRRTAQLNDRQLEVLRWVGEGCPSVELADTYKRTAQALKDRRLVTVSRAGGQWSATLTADGRYYLKHQRFPWMPTTSTSKASKKTRPSTAQPSPAHKPADSVPTAARSQSKLSADELVARVVAAGGVLDEDELPPNANVHQLLRSINRYDKAPPGKRLERRFVPGDGNWGLRGQLILKDGPAGTGEALQPVPVPARVTRYHPAVAGFAKDKSLPVQRDQQARAMRVLHALAVAAEERGLVASVHRPAQPHDLRSRPKRYHLLLTKDVDTVALAISEEKDRIDHVPTARERADLQRYPYTRVTKYDYVPSGRLRLDVDSGPHSDRRSFWADRQSWRLEDKLPEVLGEVSIRAGELRLKREAHEQAAAAHEAAVEAERGHARERAATKYRADILGQQLADWRSARDLRQFAWDLAERIDRAVTEGAPTAKVAAARRWLDWVLQRAERLDPLTELPNWPNVPQLRDYQLGDFMERVPEPLELRYSPPRY